MEQMHFYNPSLAARATRFIHTMHTETLQFVHVVMVHVPDPYESETVVTQATPTKGGACVTS